MYWIAVETIGILYPKPRDKGERQARDGKTSIKRLLRRMGVESAASAAAPRKEKDMEVTIG